MEDIGLRAVLQPRAESEGGPVTLLHCRGCGEQGALETPAGGPAVLAPPEAVGLGPARAPRLLRGRAGSRRAALAEAWRARWGAAFHELRAARFRGGGEREPTPPPRPRATADGAPEDRTPPPPPPAPPPRPAPPRAGLPTSRAEALAALGLPADATAAQAQEAWRDATRRCHPDLVAHLDPDFRRLAHEKILVLNAAREVLLGRKARRGGGV